MRSCAWSVPLSSKLTGCWRVQTVSLGATRHLHHKRQPFSSSPFLSCSAGQGNSTPTKSSGSASLPAPVTNLEAASVTMKGLVSRPGFVLAAAVGFCVIAFDVNNPASLHFLPHNIDQPAHAWVKANLPTPIKNLVAEKLVSDLFITGGIAGWVLAGAAGISKSGWNGVKRLAIALLLYVFGGGSIQHGKQYKHACIHKQPYTPLLSVHDKLTGISSRTIQGHITLLSMMTSHTVISGDPFVVNQLKTHFQRLRPSDILNTYSFPSGHTTAAVFIMGKHSNPAHSMHFQLAVKTV